MPNIAQNHWQKESFGLCYKHDDAGDGHELHNWTFPYQEEHYTPP